MKTKYPFAELGIFLFTNFLFIFKYITKVGYNNIYTMHSFIRK